MRARALALPAVFVVAAALVPVGTARPTLALGAHGRAVRMLELQLAWHGFPSGPIDGRFGGRVEAALRRFQRSAGLAPDGIAGSATLAALRRAVPRSPIPLGWPLLAPVGSGFGVRWGRFHAGVDLVAPAGTAVVSAAPGVVTWAGRKRGGWGLLVVVRHPGGVRTLYAHLSRVLVHVRDFVAGGSVIGRVGATGDATGPHLHFEVRVRGAAVDPLRALVSLRGG